MLAGAGVHRVLTVDLHADQIQGFFDIPVDNVYASPVLLGDVWKQKYPNLLVVSPDVGGVVRARAIAKRLDDADLAIIDKRRPRANESEVMNIIGEVEGKSCVLVDDLVDTAGTLCHAAKALKEVGASRVVAYITHAVLSGRRSRDRGLGPRRARLHGHHSAAGRGAEVAQDPPALRRGAAGRDDAPDPRRGKRELALYRLICGAAAAWSRVRWHVDVHWRDLMKTAFELTAEFREGPGKGASRRLRHANKVPAILYGGHREPRALSLDHTKLMLMLDNERFYSTIISLKVGDATQAAILKDVQRHPARNAVLHVDLQRVLENEKIRMTIPLHFKGAAGSPGVKAGGVVSHLRNDVDISCLPKDLPSSSSSMSRGSHERAQVPGRYPGARRCRADRARARP
jgi:ribosomal protein bL25 (Ctc-form)